jgi:hypothetical protein
MAQTTICLYGSTDTAKTTQIGFLSLYLYKKYKKPLRLVSADTGGGWKSIQKYVDAGLVIPYSIRNEPNPLLALHKIVQGYWPMDMENGERKTGRFAKDLSNVSSYAFEGLTSISDLIMNHMSGKKLSQDSAYKVTIDASGLEIISSGKDDTRTQFSKEKWTDDKGLALGTEVIGTAAQAHYGFVQDKVPIIMEKSWDLPVELVIWTAHEAVGEDNVNGATVRGPALVGKKGTSKLGRKVGMMIHSTKVGKVVANQPSSVELRYYFVTHADVTNPMLTWPAKPRVDSEVIPSLLEKFKGGYFVPTVHAGSGIDGYLEVEESLTAKGVDELKELIKKLN